MVELIVDKKLLKKVALNARLILTEKELEQFVPQIKEVIVKSFNKLDELETNEEPSFQPVKIENKLREDKEKDCLTQKEVFSNAKKELIKKGYFKGPKVL